MKERKMPHNVEAEQSVLGACFLSNTALQKVCENLNADMFYIEANSKIFEVINNLYINKVPIDVTTVINGLQTNKELGAIGGIEYLNEIICFVPTAANVDYYIGIVCDKYSIRKLIETATKIVTLGYQEEQNADDMIDEAERKMLNVSKNRKASEFKKIQDVMTKAQENLEILAENKGKITGIPSGFYDLDRLTSGFHENEFIIIAARPAIGKTALALNMATTVAKSSKKAVAVFNLEMGAEQLANRIISSLGQVDGYKLRSGHLEHNDWKRVNEAISQIADTNLFIDDTPGISVGEIRAKCRRLASSEMGLSMVIIDYLQLITGNSKYAGNRQQEVSDISRSLKTLAMELNVPIIALAQLSREVEKREDKRPIMSDLRESGSIEQDADIVMALYRDDYYNIEARTDDNNSSSELIIFIISSTTKLFSCNISLN